MPDKVRFPVRGARLWPTATFLTLFIAGLTVMAVATPGWVRALAVAGAAMNVVLLAELLLPHFVEVTDSQVRVKVGAHTFRMARDDIATVRTEPGRLGVAGLVFVGTDGTEHRPERMALHSAAGRRYIGAEEAAASINAALNRDVSNTR